MRCHTLEETPAEELRTAAERLLMAGTAPDGAELVARRKSRVYRYPREDGRVVYLKHYCATQPKERLKRLVRNPVRNLALWQRLDGLGIETPHPLLIAEHGRESVLVTAEVAHTTARQWLRDGRPLEPSLLAALGTTWGRLHTHGMQYVDPSPANVFIPDPIPEALGLLDLDSLYQVGWIPEWLARQRLGQLFSRWSAECAKQDQPPPDPEAFLAFWQAYGAVTGRPTRSHALAVARRVEERTARGRGARAGDRLAATARRWRERVLETR
ncbi:serine/threonine protein kinase [Halorhodospira halophila]|uniref:Mn2+-dependent serine/threonine protein kinase n=1 Tax=Halorhodospira halophila (strain DSM 244 / SL1) TaxID=349124 RepID=A1WV66_HALHL|nr:serine/threonine protein kinase [Halorhodospira halophila]ABM61578.1 Mn2+-dependent serine/threonine protein kinase [Halorhodospira halophila SL1]MBK1728822.1 hypothetical protein [Halorhodospira halophila]